ncbi:potassium voltage-gated channel subfamily KQT member 1-like [Diabrotica virgifera virgifera]|uniref:Potassium voltage-gated channel subfamily KQT member 1-like n=1 Tax=Diabrotica virgifera virgifera TaxID=50390 RepID=A0ABM5KAZ4_DIAVI|nr:potassium voltage-gated channel subfamily KQT member 1-like [Diabrotica virgifera virgifera]
MPHLGKSVPEKFGMALDEQQKLLNAGGRSQLSVTIVEVAGTPAPSPLSDRSNEQLLQTPLDSAPSSTCCQGINPTALLLESPPKWGEAARYAVRQHRKIAGRATFQGQVYNFLERPDNWKCFVYHIIV